MNGWVPVTKNLVNYLPKDRAYTIIEAYFSYRVNIDNGIDYPLNRYAKLWSWSRNKVRAFIEILREKDGQCRDNPWTVYGHPIPLVLLGSQDSMDKVGTIYGQSMDNIYNTNTDTKKHITETSFPVSARAGGSKVIKTKNGAFKPPPVSDVCAYAEEQGLTLDAQYYFDSRESTGWVKINGAEVKNWKNDMNNADKNGWPKANSERKLVQ